MRETQHIGGDTNSFRLVLLSEINSVRRMVSLTATIIVGLILLNIGVHAYRIYLIDQRIKPMQAELDSLHKDLNYVCKHTRTGTPIQCRIQPASQQPVDGIDG